MPEKSHRINALGSLCSPLALIVLAGSVLAGPPAVVNNLVALTMGTAAEAGSSGAALADDDDDDGDDDDGGSGGGGGGGGSSAGSSRDGNQSVIKPRARQKPKQKQRVKQRREAKAQVQRRAPIRQNTQARAAPPVVLDAAAEAEIIALGLTGAAIAALEAAGYRVVQRDLIDVLDTTLTRLAVPGGRSLDAARAEITGAGATVEADLNHFYRTRAAVTDERCDGVQCAAFAQINWRPTAVSSCTRGVVIGMIDTGVNDAHAVFAGRDFSTLDLSMPGMAASGQSHGTAVASILIGDAAGRVPGLVPDARLIAADVFHKEGRDERADAFALIRAMDMLAEEGARVINMSLAGPHNPLLEIMAKELSANGVALVAAAGNEGPNAPPAFPAAYGGVIAVTAVDASGRVFRRANQGSYVDIAAPGVGIWAAASVRGARQQTGTSFAAPFVTAAVAATADDGSSPIEAKLSAAARDLGGPGRDPVFGVGLVQAPERCAP